jgi:hypothetical protein
MLTLTGIITPVISPPFLQRFCMRYLNAFSFTLHDIRTPDIHISIARNFDKGIHGHERHANLNYINDLILLYSGWQIDIYPPSKIQFYS